MNTKKLLQTCEFEDLFIYQKECMRKYKTILSYYSNDKDIYYEDMIQKFIKLLNMNKNFRIANDHFQVAMIVLNWSGTFIRVSRISDKKKPYIMLPASELFNTFLRGSLHLL